MGMSFHAVLSDMLTRDVRSLVGEDLILIVLRDRSRVIDLSKVRKLLCPGLKVIPEETVNRDGVVGFESCL